MAVICIVYDLHSPGQAWSKMDEAIESLQQGGGRAFNTTWLLATSMTPNQVYERIAHVTDQNDKLMVFRATTPGVWKGLNQKWTDWLQENL